MEHQINLFKQKVSHTVHAGKPPYFTRIREDGFLWKFLVPFFSVLITFLLLFSTPLRVTSYSMEPTLNTGDFVLVEKFSLSFSYLCGFIFPETSSFSKCFKPSRGDMMVYVDVRQDDKPFVVKRIIAEPSEVFSIENDIISVKDLNGFVTTFEKYSHLGRADNGENMTKILGPEDFLLLGDNRPGSKDGRHYGSVQEHEMYGRVYFRFWPLASFGFVK